MPDDCVAWRHAYSVLSMYICETSAPHTQTHFYKPHKRFTVITTGNYYHCLPGCQGNRPPRSWSPRFPRTRNLNSFEDGGRNRLPCRRTTSMIWQQICAAVQGCKNFRVNCCNCSNFDLCLFCFVFLFFIFCQNEILYIAGLNYISTMYQCQFLGL